MSITVKIGFLCSLRAKDKTRPNVVLIKTHAVLRESVISKAALSCFLDPSSFSDFGNHCTEQAN